MEEAVIEEAVRLREANRKQLILHPTDLHGLLDAEHPAQTIRRVLEGVNLECFKESIKAREGTGRDATDLKILLAFRCSPPRLGLRAVPPGWRLPS